MRFPISRIVFPRSPPEHWPCPSHSEKTLSGPPLPISGYSSRHGPALLFPSFAALSTGFPKPKPTGILFKLSLRAGLLELWRLVCSIPFVSELDGLLFLPASQPWRGSLGLTLSGGVCQFPLSTAPLRSLLVRIARLLSGQSGSPVTFDYFVLRLLPKSLQQDRQNQSDVLAAGDTFMRLPEGKGRSGKARNSTLLDISPRLRTRQVPDLLSPMVVHLRVTVVVTECTMA